MKVFTSPHKQFFLQLFFLISSTFFCITAQASVTLGESKTMLDTKLFHVENFTTKLVDTKRITPKNGKYEGADSRTLKATIWYPGKKRSLELLNLVDAPVATAKGPFPLLVYSHGFMSFRKESKPMLEHLAAQGYIIISAEYPLSHFFAPGGPTLEDLKNQPGDISFMIDTLLSWSSDKNHRLYQSIDEKRIGVLGVSLGGMTTSLVTYHPKLRDKRIAAAISIAGPSAMFGSKFYENSDAHFMMIAASNDAMVDYESNASVVLDRIPNATLVTNIGGSHTGFSHTAKTFFRLLSNPDSIGCAAIKRNLDLDKSMDDPFRGLGGPDEGLIEAPKKFPCEIQPLPKAMALVKQHAITTLATQSFFEQHFNQDQETRQKYKNYLADVLAKENNLAKVEFSQ